jgi:hypothetical protein
MANYNNTYFPQTYAPYVYGASAVPAQTLAAPAQPQGNSITWVQGEAGARSINVPAGQTALLMDSETNIFYIKTTDVSGIPLPLRVFKYEELNSSTPKVESAHSTYITKEELETRLEELLSQLKEDNSNGQFDI